MVFVQIQCQTNMLILHIRNTSKGCLFTSTQYEVFYVRILWDPILVSLELKVLFLVPPYDNTEEETKTKLKDPPKVPQWINGEPSPG